MDYLAEHPAAMDTAEGIAEWWLVRQILPVNVETLKIVLHRLTEQGVLEEIPSREGVRYRLRQKEPADQGG
jgi:hypothetical protein